MNRLEEILLGADHSLRRFAKISWKGGNGKGKRDDDGAGERTGRETNHRIRMGMKRIGGKGGKGRELTPHLAYPS